MDSDKLYKEMQKLTRLDIKHESVRVFTDAYENIIECFPSMDPYLHYELAKEVMKLECSMNHEEYHDTIERNVPDNMLDIPLGRIADGLYHLSDVIEESDKDV